MRLIIRLVEFRKKLDISQIEMAKKLDVSCSFYQKIENGDRNPSYNFISNFKRTFNIKSVDDIFFD
ncbi:helix-turn-helix transcriptional regulator [Vallitalea maricola]|uniref:helix-turn-helix transcriptional regulator n=1 Tax=Vallitalea maricola TaxID=3074433 RepID=UPI0030D784E1